MIKQYTVQHYKPHLKYSSDFKFQFTSFNIPQRKQPQTLSNKGIRKVRAIVREVVPSWIGRLFPSTHRDIQYCQQQAQKMTNDSNAANSFYRRYPHVF
jgi:hypothetical protein